MIPHFGCGYKRVECVHEFDIIMIIFVITVEWHTQTRFGLVGPIVSAQQPFYYNIPITSSCVTCVQVGMLQLDEIDAPCVG